MVTLLEISIGYKLYEFPWNVVAEFLSILNSINGLVIVLSSIGIVTLEFKVVISDDGHDSQSPKVQYAFIFIFGH